MTHIVPDNTPLQRLSDYARHIFPHLRGSGQGIRKAIKRGYVLVDGAASETGTWVRAGMEISWMEPDYTGKVFAQKIGIVYEDEHLAVVEKPAGIPTSGNQYRTLEHALPFNMARSLLPGSFAIPQPVHRLDLLTSGLVLIGKTYATHAALSRQFAERTIQKSYTALVHGAFPETAVFDDPVKGKDARTRAERIRVYPSGKEANLSLVRLFPETGRKHQLRIHLSGRGYPIVGDPIYCPEALRVVRRGMFLNATSLAFTHPVTETSLQFEMAVPNKFRRYGERKERLFQNSASS